MNKIIVGQHYTHINHPGVLYLGCGDIINRFSPNKKIKNKKLIIVRSPNPFFMGNMVALRRKSGETGFCFSEFEKTPNPYDLKAI